MWSQEHNSSLLLGLFQHSSMSSSILVFLLSCIYSLGNCLGYWRCFLVLSWAEPNMGTLLWSEDAFSSFWYWRLFRLFVEYSSWYLSSCKRQYSVLICCPIPLLGTREHSGTYHDPDILIWQTIFQLTWTYQDLWTQESPHLYQHTWEWVALVLFPHCLGSSCLTGNL